MQKTAGLSEPISSNLKPGTTNAYIKKLLISAGIIAALLLAKQAGA